MVSVYLEWFSTGSARVCIPLIQDVGMQYHLSREVNKQDALSSLTRCSRTLAPWTFALACQLLLLPLCAHELCLSPWHRDCNDL